MPTYKVAFAYTRVQLMDKLEEQLVAALNHRYLISLLDDYKFTHYLMDHWADEYQTHVTKTADVLAHVVKLSRPGRLRALRAVQDRLTQQDARIRRAAHRHFLGVFHRTISDGGAKADLWLTAKTTDEAQDEFWQTIHMLANDAIFGSTASR